MRKSLQSPIGSTRISLLVNVLLFAFKLYSGIVGRSQALVADALNSLLDIVSNIVVWLGIVIARRPADGDHPYGHGNADTLAAVFVALVLLLTGGYIGREAIGSIIQHSYTSPTYIATVAAAITIIIKTVLYFYTVRIGRKFRSQAVIANAEDHRTDVIVSIGTLTGIIIAQTEYPVLDPVASLWVALFIWRQAVKIIHENIHTLMVGAPRKSRQEEIEKYISNLEGVRGIKWLKGRVLGPGVYIDTAILVEGGITVKEGHDIASFIRERVVRKFPEIIDILVHIEPDEE